MKTLKNCSVLTLAFIMFCGFKFSNDIPKGWFKAGDAPKSYKMGVDNAIFKNGQKSAFIESIDEKIKGFGTLMQTCDAKEYLGKRIKMTGYIKSENVAEWAGMWLRIDAKSGHDMLGFDNMENRAIKGTSDWTKCEIVLDVPNESGTLNFGILLSGTGKVWFDNISFEVVDKETPVTKSDKNTKPEKPVNIDFEE